MRESPSIIPITLNPHSLPIRSLILAAALMTAGYAQASVSEVADSPEIRAAAELHLMAGELAAGRNQPGIAARELLLALKVFQDKELASRATTYALAAGDADLALAAATRWLELDGSAMEAREIIARMALLKGDAAETYAQGIEIVKADKQGAANGLLQIARILSQSNAAQADVAIKVMSKIVALYPDLSAGQHALALVALRYNNLDLADDASIKASRLEPDNREHALLRIGVLVKQKKLQDADKAFATLLKDEKNPSELHMGYVKLLLESNQQDHAREQLQALLKEEPEYPDALYALGILSLNDKDYETAENQFKPLLSGNRAQEAAFQLGRLAEAKGDYAGALEYYSRVLKGNLVIDASIRRAYALAGLKQLDAAQQLMAQMREQLPHLASRLYLAEADLMAQNRELDRALAIYDAGLKHEPDDEELLYGRSIVYERQNKVKLAEKDLRAMVAKDAKDARALNALGYMLTVHTQRYSEARRLIARSLELNPGDPAVMDSLGWVQFKLGKKKEALALLKAAYDQFPDAEVAAHLGEVLWALGDKEQARTIWQKALKDAPDHEVLNETIKRFPK